MLFGRNATQNTWSTLDRDNPDSAGADFLGTALGAIPLREQRHTPLNLLAGTCPYVAGREDEVVWHAAADACGTERLHYVWSVQGDRIWYLATPSVSLAGEPHSWCAFSALLPGMPRALSRAACYIEKGETFATLLAYHPGGIEIHQGDLPVVQHKADSIARRIGRGGDPAPIVAVETIARLPKTPWRSMSLMEDRLRRVTAGLVLGTGVITTFIAGVVWLGATVVGGLNIDNAEQLRAQTDSAVQTLATQADNLSRSEITADLGKLMDVDRALLRYGGILRRFETKNGQATYVASVPIGLSPEQIAELGARVTGTEGRLLILEGTR